MDFSHLIASVGLALTSFFGVPAEPMMLGAQAALTAFQGGTGTSSPSGILYGDETIRLKTVTIGSNLTFSGGTLSATGGASSTLLSDSNTFTNTITGSITGNAGTASALAANGTNCSTGNAALGVDASGNAENCFTVSTFAYPFPGQATTTNTQFNGGAEVVDLVVHDSLSFNDEVGTSWAGLCQYITGGASLCDGADADTTYTAGDALTLTGNDIDFDGGATPGGVLGGTWASPTLDDNYLLNTGDTGTGLYTLSYASTTGISTAYASSTLYYGAGLADCNSGNMLTWTSGRFGCEDDSTGVGGGTFPFTPTSYGNSTSTTIAFTQGIISAGSTTLSALGSGLVGANDGRLYGFASSSLFGYSPLNPTRQLTVAGTANQITSSAGAQTLEADRTWTLSLPSHVIFPGNFQATNATTTNATTSSLYVTGLTSALSLFDSNGQATEYGGIDCTNQFVRDVSSAGSGTCASVVAADFGNSDWGELTASGGSVTIDDDVLGAEHFADQDWGDITISSGAASVEDDSHAHTGATISGLDISADTNLTAGDGLTLTDDDLDCDTASASIFGCLTAAHWSLFDNKVSSTSIDTSTELASFISGETGSGALVFGTAPTISNATLSSTTLTGNFVFANATGTNATTTNFAVTGTASTSKFFADGLTSCTSNNVLTWTGGVFGCEADDQGAGGAYPFTPGTFGSTNTSATSTAINGIGGFISTASSTLQKLTIELSTTTAATTTQLAITSFLNLGGDSIDELVGDGLDVLSGDLIFDCSDVVGTALTCTGEDLGVTANSIGDTQLAFDTGQALTTASSPTFANITDSGLTSGRVTYAGASGLLSDEAAFTYNSSTDVLTTVAASTTNLTVGTWFQIPSLASFTSVLAGAFGLDTTQNQLKIGTGSNSRVYATDEKWMRVPFASTTQGVGSTTIYAGPAPFAQTFTTVQCDFSNFMGVSLYDGTNRSTYFVASSTIGTTTLASNNSFNMGETIRIDVGTSTDIGAAVRGGCTFKYRIDPT